MSTKVIPKPDFLDQEAWNNLIATRDAKVIAAVAKLHVQQYIDAKGEGDTYLTQGAPTCLVTSIGRKTGNEVTSPANFMQEGDDVYVVGSIAGLDKHPHWALNLDAKREGWVQIKANKYPVEVHRLIGGEREAVWPRLIEFFPLWGHFQKYCDREFMVFRLSPSEPVAVADEIDPRLANGLVTALKLFKPGSPGAPSFEYPKEIAADWNQFSVSTVMGDVWGREGLELKDRAKITLGVLTALGKLEQLEAYVVGGLNLGLTREEICEIVLHVSVYAGFPAAIQGFGAVNRVFEKLDAGSD